MDTTSILALVIAIGGLVPSILAIFLQRRGDRAKVNETEAQAALNLANADKINSDTAVSLLDPLKQRISEMEIIIANFKKEIARMEITAKKDGVEIIRLTAEGQAKDRKIGVLETKVIALEEEVKYLRDKNNNNK
jgi:hypothetical protein